MKGLETLQELYVEELVRIYEKRDLRILEQEMKKPTITGFLIGVTQDSKGKNPHLHIQYTKRGTKEVIRLKF